MGAWEGGKVPVAMIVPGLAVGQTAQTAPVGTSGLAIGQTAQTAPVGTYQQQNRSTLLNQVFQGAGQTFAAAAGQAVGLTGGNTAIQVAVTNAASRTIKSLGTGFDLTKGLNIAATSLTSSIPGIVSSSLNQSIAKSLASAGQFAPLLTTIATNLTQSLVGGVVNGLLGNGQGVGGLLGGTPGGSGENYKSFPGAGQNESAADYGGGGSYTLGLNGGDVVFSIRPAGSGAQSTGSPLGEDPKTPTTLSTDQKTGIPRATTPSSQAANGLKNENMNEGRNEIFDTTVEEENAAIKRSLDRQNRGDYGQQFKNLRPEPLF